MPKPKNKTELLQACHSEFSSLTELLEGLTGEQLNCEFPLEMLNRNVRDVLAHVHHWHLLLLGWYKTANNGELPKLPTSDYRWNETPALNRDINRKYAKHSLNRVLSLLNESHQRVIGMINEHSNKQLFTKMLFAWTGSTSLGAYIISNSSSHYRWAGKVIGKATK